jgi:hypothetical protein
MDWRCGESSRAPVLQVQSFDFKPQSHQKERVVARSLGVVFYICSPSTLEVKTGRLNTMRPCSHRPPKHTQTNKSSRREGEGSQGQTSGGRGLKDRAEGLVKSNE